MSRLIVKNIPKLFTEEKLRKHFTQQGTVTDAKIMFKNGLSRKFGFVGYKSDEEAKAALKFFNGTYLNTSKLVVELAKT